MGGPVDQLIRFKFPAAGPVPSPFDAYLVNRGLKTLHLRMREHMKNGLAVAKFLEAHPAVEKVLHPGTPQYILQTHSEEALKNCCKDRSSQYKTGPN